MKTIISGYEAAIENAARHLRGLLEKKPDAVIALTVSESCMALYGRLAELCAEGALSFAETRFFAVTEFDGLEEWDTLSCRSRLERDFLRRVDAKEKNCVFLTRENLDTYDDLIAKAGGLDLALLDIGVNARIGFNEPATPFDSHSHRQKLTTKTRRELADDFGGEEKVPAYGLTMGIHTLVSAREILVLTAGEGKADAVYKMLYARNDSAVPAAFLQLPLQVTLYLEEQAAAKL